MEEKNENQNLPTDFSSDEGVKKKKGLKTRVTSALEKREEKAAQNDVIFYAPLKEEPKDETAPLHKGSIDMWFLLWTLLLLCFGVVMSYSASAFYAQDMYDSSMHFFWRYIIFTLVAAVIAVFFVIYARPWFWRAFGIAAYAGSVVLLIIVRIAGHEGGGAERWIDLGFITIQPSEIAKMAVVLVLALYLSKYEKEVNSTHKFGGSFKHGFFIPMIIIGILCGLIALQPHLSGLMIVGMIGVAVMFLAGTRLKWLFIFVGVIAVAGVLFISFFGYTMVYCAMGTVVVTVSPAGASGAPVVVSVGSAV